MILNDWQIFFLTKLVPTLESLGSVVEIFAFIAIIILLPALLYFCNKNIGRCYTELKRQNRLLQSQTQNIHELNSWMEYFDDKIIHREKTSSKRKIDPAKIALQKKQDSLPEKKDPPQAPATPVSIYKKTI